MSEHLVTGVSSTLGGKGRGRVLTVVVVLVALAKCSKVGWRVLTGVVKYQEEW